jgi:hypothetical protein
MASTAQGVVEILVLRNLGLAAESAPVQAGVLCLLLAGAWAWTRGRPFRLNPLEAAGAATALLGFALVYTVRGYFAFDMLRDLSWYQAIPEIGAALFAAGWWVGRGGTGEPPPRRLPPPTTRGLLAVTAIATVALLIQAPRVRAQIIAQGHAMAPSERIFFATPKLQRFRARALASLRVQWQRKLLGHLDQAQAIATSAGASRESIRRGFGRVVVPGMPGGASGFDGGRLLALPETGGRDDPAETGRVLAPHLTLAPEPRPDWVRRGEPWPPKP